MNKSESIGKLALALSKLQGEIQNLHKDKSGYGYKYTELASVLDVTRPLCAKYELAVTQLCTEGKEEVSVETVLLHSSGEWISGTLSMALTIGKGMSAAQAAGSVITYARRYSLAALLGIAQTDNDASIREERDAPAQEKKAVSRADELKFLIEKNKLQHKEGEWCTYFKVASLSDLPDRDLDKLINKILENSNDNV